MRLDIPLDLPGHSFIDQLEWLETWACLPSGTLKHRSEELAASRETEQGIKPVILQCIEGKPWVWPAYKAYAKENDEEREDEAQCFKDKAEHIYRKYRSRHYALHRKLQMEPLKYLRPYWEFSGRCASPDYSDDNALLVLDADDDYWETAYVPWRCEKLDCQCQIHSLSEFEYRNI